jgi:hypothetical protein
MRFYCVQNNYLYSMSYSFFPSYPSFGSCNCKCNQTSLDDTSVVEPNDKFKIVVILDESGSMDSIRKNMLDSLNDLIREQKQIKERPATFTLIKFNDKIHNKYENIPLDEVKELTSEDYVPNGSTALYDAIGYTINRFRNERDVLMVIITDGQENASRKYGKQFVSTKLEEKKKYNKWSYVYLSCDLQTFEQGASMGLRNSDFASNIQMRQDSYGSYISNNLNCALSNFRKKGVSVQSQLN